MSQSNDPSCNNPALLMQWPEAYAELRRIAGRLMSRERPDHTLAATALVHEAWLKLAGPGQMPVVADRAHFFALAARAMRHILVNHAQAKKADKRGGGVAHLTLAEAEGVAAGSDPTSVLAVDQALKLLANVDPRAAEVAELKVFGGLENAEIAQLLGISEPTVKRDWVFARAQLAQSLK
jgi:RNA polymerase sigma factor (TIGR02999 family)